MTEIALLRLASVPSALVAQVREHVRGCPHCKDLWNVEARDTRWCPDASAMIECRINCRSEGSPAARAEAAEAEWRQWQREMRDIKP